MQPRLTVNDALSFCAGYATDGARAYVCVEGGVDVPPVLGSRSTDLRAGLCVSPLWPHGAC